MPQRQPGLLSRPCPQGGSGLVGVAFFDADRDGWLDLFVAGGRGRPNALFHNNGDGTFTDIAVEAGVANGLGNSGVVAADLDNDGFQDLFLTNDGGLVGSPVKLYRNQGDLTFADITAGSGIIGPESNLSAAFADLDNDGFLDLFITAPGSLADKVQHANQLYHNNGDLTFTDISVSSGVNTALGACATFFSDYDRDGWIDLFVADCNDVNFARTPIELFRNNRDLTFTDMRLDAGLEEGGSGWVWVRPTTTTTAISISLPPT